MAERWARDVVADPQTTGKVFSTEMRAYSKIDGVNTNPISTRQRTMSVNEVSPTKGTINGLKITKPCLSSSNMGSPNQYSYSKHNSNRHHTPRVNVNNFAVRKHRDGTNRTTTPRTAWTAPSAGEHRDGSRNKSLSQWVDSITCEDNNNNKDKKNDPKSTGSLKHRPNSRIADDVDSHSTLLLTSGTDDSKTELNTTFKDSGLSVRNGSTSSVSCEQWEVSSVSSRSSGFTSVSAVDRGKLQHYQYGPTPISSRGDGYSSYEHLPALHNRRHSSTAPSGEVFSPRGSIASRHTIHGGDLDSYRPVTAVPAITNIDMILNMAMKKVDDTHRMSEHLSFAQNKKKDFNSRSSSEFKKVLEQINIEDDDTHSRDSGSNGINRLRRSGRKLSKNWSSLRSKLRTVSSQRTSVAGGNNRRVSEAVPTIDEEKESDIPEKHKKKMDAMSRPLGKGWKFVKANLKKIVQMADEGKIEPGPNFRQPVLNPFKSLRDIIMGKEFQMMMRRKASFVENGVFQFEAAKRDLYARYKPIPVASNTNSNLQNNVVQRKFTKRISSGISR